MEKTEKKTKTDESGSAFVDNQRVADQAKNERIKEETRSEKLDPEDANNPSRRGRKTSVSEKNTGGGKQSSPGD